MESSSLHTHLHHTTLIIFPHILSTTPSIVSFPYRLSTLRFAGLKAASSSSSSSSRRQDEFAYDLLRKPVVEVKDEVIDSDYEDDGGNEDGWIDWEDRILEDTVPLVGFVRMILHSTKYASGERLSPEHERTILERLLPHHPESEKKIGCGIKYITVGYHPDFESSRCLFIVRKDGELVDFSYWKCIKGLIRKNYPLYADNFILRHFRRRRHND
ncbi:protein DCL, chloroplastic-like [Bidens hawaiensis]|uniref:protein DCL, chloroplastic-like n=1 Tax=Bidens hawaiensis TaxID=980011 RepID=UPI004049E163